ncbi:MerR family transcriptional regulator [Nocardia brasiliensis]|uniref:MerR family transcriptional regulator n=1 Tax=Nocardia brasiliensis TaxID=37326 RepID=UPI00245504DC|nr:MerR family transcriptional regulator [Nocardia brasiliensis]
MGAPGAGFLQIGQVAERTELSLKTIRHYDEVGLVQPSARSAGGYRLYTDTDVERLLVIRRMKPLGFTLAEMNQLLDALATLDDPAADTAGRDRARVFVQDMHAQARERCATLACQLAYAEEFTDLLAARTDR